MRQSAMVILLIAVAACDRAPHAPATQVTVKLPEARPSVPRPGFSIGAGGEAQPAAPVEIDG